MDATRAFFVLMSTLTLFGCEEWPPLDEEGRENFIENRETFEALEQKLAATNYETVRMRFKDHARGEFMIDDVFMSEDLEDGAEWNRLLTKAGVFAVARQDKAFLFGRGFIPFEGETAGMSIYIHHAELGSEVKQCRSEYKEARCGACAVKLDDGWWMYYRWFPTDLVPEASEARSNKEMSYDEYGAILDAAIDECIYEGYSQIGYEMEPPSRE